MRPTTTAPWCPCSKDSPATQHRNQPQGRARLGPVLFGGGAAGAGRGDFSAVGRWSRLDRRRLAPARWVPARSRAGIQAFSRESPDAKSRGGVAPAPPFMARSFPTRSFWRLWRIVPVEGLFRCPCTCPDLGRFFVWGCTTQRLPLGGKLSPKVTDEGATGLPNGAKEKARWGDRRENAFFYKERLVTNRPLIRPSVRTGAPSPRGEGFGGGKNPSRLRNHLPQPAQPGGGPLRTLDYGPQARQKRGREPRQAPQPEKVGPGRKNLFLPGVLSSGFLPKKAGLPRRSWRGRNTSSS